MTQKLLHSVNWRFHNLDFSSTLMTCDSLIYLASLYKSVSRDKIAFLAIINSSFNNEVTFWQSYLKLFEDSKQEKQFNLGTHYLRFPASLGGAKNQKTFCMYKFCCSKVYCLVLIFIFIYNFAFNHYKREVLKVSYSLSLLQKGQNLEGFLNSFIQSAEPPLKKKIAAKYAFSFSGVSEKSIQVVEMLWA